MGLRSSSEEPPVKNLQDRYKGMDKNTGRRGSLILGRKTHPRTGDPWRVLHPAVTGTTGQRGDEAEGPGTCNKWKREEWKG